MAAKKWRETRGLPVNSLRIGAGNFLRPCRELNRAIRESFALIREIAMAGSGKRWIAPTNAEYRQGARSTELNHSRSERPGGGKHSGHRRGPLDPESRAWHVRESFAVLRSASSENDSAATPERDRPNRSAVVRSPAPGNQIPPKEGPMPNLYFAPADVGATLARLPRQRRSPSNHSHC